jgi:hypothetical protein
MENELLNIVKENSEKLDLIISALSSHPDYEESLKKALMEREIDNVSKNVILANDAVLHDILKTINQFIAAGTYMGYASNSFEYDCSCYLRNYPDYDEAKCIMELNLIYKKIREEKDYASGSPIRLAISKLESKFTTGEDEIQKIKEAYKTK